MLTVYSKSNCPMCVQAKNLLKSKNVEFEEIRVDEVPEARQLMLDAGHRSVPQIYQNGKLFVEGGFQGLAKLSESQLKEKLNVIN